MKSGDACLLLHGINKLCKTNFLGEVNLLNNQIPFFFLIEMCVNNHWQDVTIFFGHSNFEHFFDEKPDELLVIVVRMRCSFTKKFQ